jgi:signal transduction histidine kinase
MNKKVKKKSENLLVILAMLYVGIILALGSWWLYLIVKYGEVIASITGDDSGERALKMVKWEGGTFLTLLILTSVTLLYLYVRDKKKTKGLQAFYASMTHELKTPLASIRLQSEVLAEECENLNNPKIETLVGRLIEDGHKMETQMDKILQLSRLEGGGHFNLGPINLVELITNTHNNWGQGFEVNLQLIKSKDDPPVNDTSDNQFDVLGDELALQLTLKNLFENTQNHAQTPKANITLEKRNGQVVMTYEDDGKFEGDKTQLGHLFYKHNSSKGSGIGLYLITKLAEAMNAKVVIIPATHMTVVFTFSRPRPQDLEVS